MLISLGIESTAHTFGIGIVGENKKIFSNVWVRFTTKEGGIHPREAAEFHKDYIVKVLDVALKKAGFIKINLNNSIYLVDLKDICEKHDISFEEKFLEVNEKEDKMTIARKREITCDEEKIKKIINDFKNGEYDLQNYEKINLISVSAGPGLFPTLFQGVFFAKELAYILDLPIVGVNHPIAHLEILKMWNNFEDPVILYVSGANTQVIAYEGKRYRVFGETLDIGVGNFLDKFGREIRLGFPAGPKIEELASKGKNLIELPYTVKGMDIQLSGLLTHLKKIKDKYSLEDLCYSVQEYVFAMLTEITERAVAHLNKSEVGLTGGVAANKRLQEMLKTMCEERGIKFGTVPLDLANDNGAMIAWTGIIWYKKGWRDDVETLEPNPYWRADRVSL